MYEHKLVKHPDIPQEFIPKQAGLKDMILNYIAEQNLEIMEEVITFKKDVKASFAKLTGDIKEVFNDLDKVTNVKDEETKNSLDEIKVKIHNLEKHAGIFENTKRIPVSVPPPIPSPSNSVPPAPSVITSSPSLSTPPPVSMKSTSQTTESNKMFANTKTKFLNKPKVLYIGDSVAHNNDFRNLERATKTRICTKRAYSSVKDGRARLPFKNFADVTREALSETNHGDDFTTLILSAPSDDITNIDISEAKSDDDITWFEQDVHQSCQNMFSIAQTALKSHPKMKKIIILEHAPRFDCKDIDPLSLKSKLARFANKTFQELWLASPHKKSIQIGKLNMECSDDLVEARYRDEINGRFDGVHMYGVFGKRAFTRNLIRVINTDTTNYQTKSGYYRVSPKDDTQFSEREIGAKQNQTYSSGLKYHSSVTDNNRYHILSSISENQ